MSSGVTRSIRSTIALGRVATTWLLESLRRTKRWLKWSLYRVLPRRCVALLIRSKMPRSAQIEATTACNLSCPLCITHETPRGYRFLATRVVDDLLRSCGRRLKIVCFHILGEPLLNRDLFAMIRRCSDAKVRTTFSTNGMLLNRHIDEIFDSGLTHLSIAIDGANREDYEKYRLRGSFDRVVENTTRLVREKRRRGAGPTLQAQMVMFSYNEDREASARRFLDSLGVDVVSLKRPSYVGGDSEPVREFWRKVDRDDVSRRYARPVGEATKLYRNQRMCPLLERATVLSDGSVVACCMDGRGETAFGNLHDESFKTIWRSDEHRRVLDQFMEGTLAPCQHCTLGYRDLDDEPKPLPAPSPAPRANGIEQLVKVGGSLAEP